MVDNLALSPRSSLGDEVYKKLLNEIITLRFPPGERLSIDALVRLTGVSQTPIRAALIRLEVEGLVEKKHNTGYSVTSVHSAERFRDIYEVRLLLEPAAAERVAQLATQEQKQFCAKLHDDLSKLAASDTDATYSKFALVDREFHDALARSCGNALIAETLGRLHTHMHLFRLGNQANVTTDAVKEHQVIIEAILAGDAAKAKDAMVRHIETSRDRMRPYYEKAH
jgi:DNA-binding GntR family transcriptional regulator